MDHHEFGPSSRGRIQDCPGSYWEEERQVKAGLLPPREERQQSSDASTGTRRHKAIEARILGTGGNDTTQITVEDLDVVEKAEEFFKKLGGHSPDAEVYTESLVNISDPNGIVISYGTADVIIVNRGELRADVIDWKSMWSELDPEHLAAQMEGYALGTWQKLSESIETVSVHVYQPAKDLEYHQEYCLDDFGAILEGYESDIANALHPNAEIRPLERACKYCPCKIHCSELARQSMEVVEKREQIPTDPTSFDTYRARVKAAKTYIKDLDAELDNRLKNGQPSNTHEPYEKAGRKSVGSAERAWEASGLLAIDFLKACSVSKASVLREFLRVHGHKYKSKAEAERELIASMEEERAFKQGEPAIAIRKKKVQK